MPNAQGKTATATADSQTGALTDTSLRRFKRGTVLRYGFEVYNAKPGASQSPRLTTQIRVFRDGKLLLEGKQFPLDMSGQKELQKISWSGALNLGSEMSAGDYVLQVIVNDNSAKEKSRIAAQFVQFEVVE